MKLILCALTLTGLLAIAPVAEAGDYRRQRAVIVVPNRAVIVDNGFRQRFVFVPNNRIFLAPQPQQFVVDQFGNVIAVPARVEFRFGF